MGFPGEGGRKNRLEGGSLCREKPCLLLCWILKEMLEIGLLVMDAVVTT